MSSRSSAAGLGAACLALLLAGCGSSGSTAAAPPSTGATAAPLSAAAYRAALQRVAQEEGAAQHTVQKAFHAHTVAQVRAALSAFSADQRQVAQRLGTLHPPADAAAANTQLAAAFNDNASAVQSLVRRLAGMKTVKQALNVVQNDNRGRYTGHLIDVALAKLRKLGYTSGS